MAILTSTVFSLFATPPSNLIQFFPNLAHMIFGPSRIEMTEQNFLTYWWKKKLWCFEVTRSTQYCFRGCISAKLWSIDKNLVRFIDTMKSGYKPKLGTAPPMGVEITKMHNFAYNFWKHCSNCVISLSFNSLGYADSDNVSFVNFHECACQPYWSKWQTVFSLLLIQIVSNFVQI